jgi:flagellin
MGMRIRTNVSSLITQRYAAENQQKMQSSMEKLASGYRINKSADDAAGLAVSEAINAKTRGLNVGRRNANDAVSMIQTAEGAMNEMTNIVVRMRELTVQAASDTIGDTERGYLNKEYVQLTNELDRIKNTAEFNGTFFFSEEANDEFVVQVGTNGSSPDENVDTITIKLDGLKFDTEELGLGNESEIGPSEAGGSGPSRDDIAAKLGTLDNVLSRFASERATLGAQQSRFQSAINNLGISVENLTTAKSRIKDTDFAAETAKLAQSRILTQASTSTLSQANASSDIAVSLLR